MSFKVITGCNHQEGWDPVSRTATSHTHIYWLDIDEKNQKSVGILKTYLTMLTKKIKVKSESVTTPDGMRGRSSWAASESEI